MNVDLAQRISDGASAVRGVARMSTGIAGSAATYGPGRRVDGVRVRDDRIEIHIVATGSVASLPTVAEAVREAVAGLAPASRIDVFVDDLDLDIVDLDALEPAPASLPASTDRDGPP